MKTIVHYTSMLFGKNEYQDCTFVYARASVFRALEATIKDVAAKHEQICVIYQGLPDDRAPHKINATNDSDRLLQIIEEFEAAYMNKDRYARDSLIYFPDGINLYTALAWKVSEIKRDINQHIVIQKINEEDFSHPEQVCQTLRKMLSQQQEEFILFLTQHNSDVSRLLRKDAKDKFFHYYVNPLDNYEQGTLEMYSRLNSNA